jgi:hypothetical protein
MTGRRGKNWGSKGKEQVLKGYKRRLKTRIIVRLNCNNCFSGMEE